MSGGYPSYLLAIVIIVVAVPAGCVFFLRPGRKRRAERLISLVTCGSISVFFDRAGNVTIIPYVKDRFGAGKATAGVVSLRVPYSASKLGRAVRASMDGCRGAEPGSSQELLERLKSHDWAAFSAGKRNISVYYSENHGIVLNTTVKRAEGVYEFSRRGVEMSLSPDTEDKILGDAVLELLKKCR